MNKNRLYILLLILIAFIQGCDDEVIAPVFDKEPWTKSISAIAVYDTIVWVGTSDSGLYKFDGEAWTSYTYANGLVSDTITSLALTDNGCLWVGTNMGLSRFKNGNWTNYTTTQGLYYNYIYSLASDHQNNVWIGTRKNHFTKFDGFNFTTYEVNTGYSGNNSGHIHSINFDYSGNTWIGSCSSGLSKYDGTNWTHYIENLNAFVSSSMCLANGDVWIGHYTGAYLFSGGAWTNYTKDDGLVSNYIDCFTVDKQNNIWIGTDEGLSMFNGTTWTNYTTSNGLLNNQVTSLACDSHGNIWVGSRIGGLMKISPTK